MKKNILLSFGIFYLAVGLLYSVTSFFTITGFTIADKISSAPSSLLGFALVIGGLMLIFESRREGGLEKEASKELAKVGDELRSGKVGSYNDLRRHARKLGYNLKESTNHTGVYKSDVKVTEIPRHRHVKKGTYRGILVALSENAA